MLRLLPVRAAFLAFLLVCSVTPSLAQSLKITSTPAGAKVELDGVTAGTTPLEKTFLGRYFHRTLTVIRQRLEHPMIARVSKGMVRLVGKFFAAGPGTWIQTDAPINPGNSGGPLLKSKGFADYSRTLEMPRSSKLNLKGRA